MENKRTILVVEDEELIRLFVGEELKERGYEILYAANSYEALQVVEIHVIDLVILDIRMPGMDGLSALPRILGLKEHLPVILNTAYTQYKDDFMAWGADYYFVKSSDLYKLIKAVDILINGGTPKHWYSEDGPPD